MKKMFFFFTILLASCTNKKDVNSVQFNKEITAINANYPILLNSINLQDSANVSHLNPAMQSKIRQVITSYYFNDCNGDSTQSVFKIDDVYINTICLKDTFFNVYWILLNHIPTNAVNSKVLFYDNKTQQFSSSIYDFNIHALYNFKDGKLYPSNLKTQFKITIPEIELMKFDSDNINDYKFTRLYHNGSANALETTVLKLSNNKVDTLHFIQDFEELNRKVTSRKW